MTDKYDKFKDDIGKITQSFIVKSGHMDAETKVRAEKMVVELLNCAETQYFSKSLEMNTIYEKVEKIDNILNEEDEDKQVVTKGGFGNAMLKWIKSNWWVWTLITLLGTGFIGAVINPIKADTKKILSKMDIIAEKQIDTEKEVITIKGEIKGIKSDMDTMKRRQGSEFKHLESLYNNSKFLHAGSEE